MGGLHYGRSIEWPIDVGEGFVALSKRFHLDRRREAIGIDLQQQHIFVLTVDKVGDVLNLVPERAVNEALV